MPVGQQTTMKKAGTSVYSDNKDCSLQGLRKTGATGLEPATSGVTGRRSNQLNYAPRRKVES